MPLALRPHPDWPSPQVTAIAAQVRRGEGGRLDLSYRVSGRVSDLRLPPPAAPERTDELWRRTCFEAFVRCGEGGGYHEINLAPSGQWAAYRFDGYREGMAPAELAADPQIRTGAEDGAYELDASLGLPDGLTGPWRLNLSAVIETIDGQVSYWALAHPAGKADFHHPDCFALEIPEPGRP
ncbi:MAG TPA: DOMON-like domain-containing protein [Phenylobacterium sp.]